MDTNTILTLVGISVAVLVLVGYLRRSGERLNRQEIDNQVDRLVANALGDKLKIDREQVYRSLKQVQEPDIVAAVSDAVSDVRLLFTRDPDSRAVSLSVNILYRDGATFSATQTIGWDELPENIRGAFLRGDSRKVERSWTFPWCSESDENLA